MGNIGSSELLIILVIALLLLGPKRLPDVGDALGKTIRRFRQASRELRDELDIEQETRRPASARRDAGVGVPESPAPAGAAAPTAAIAPPAPAEPDPSKKS